MLNDLWLFNDLELDNGLAGVRTDDDKGLDARVRTGPCLLSAPKLCVVARPSNGCADRARNEAKACADAFPSSALGVPSWPVLAKLNDAAGPPSLAMAKDDCIGSGLRGVIGLSSVFAGNDLDNELDNDPAASDDG